MNLRIAEGICKCPVSCPGPRTGTCGQAQGPNPNQANKGADPWSQARAGSQGDGGVGVNGSKGSGGGGSGGGKGPGGHSGGGGGAGGGGSPNPNNEGPEFFDPSGFSQDGLPRTNHKQLTQFCKSPFETKAANQDLPHLL